MQSGFFGSDYTDFDSLLLFLEFLPLKDKSIQVSEGLNSFSAVSLPSWVSVSSCYIPGSNEPGVWSESLKLSWSSATEAGNSG